MQFYRRLDVFARSRLLLAFNSITNIKSMSISIPYRGLLIGCLALIIIPKTRLECSPTFAGVPVAATFLMHQAYAQFESQFPGLELASLFDTNSSEFEYYEATSGLERLTVKIFGPSQATIIIPVYEKYSQVEEERMGSAGIKKSPVGKLQIVGKCQMGCAKVTLSQMTLFKLNDEIVWNYP